MNSVVEGGAAEKGGWQSEKCGHGVGSRFNRSKYSERPISAEMPQMPQTVS